MLFGGGRSLNVLVHTFKIRINPCAGLRLSNFESGVNILVSSIHVSSELCTGFSFMEVVGDGNSRLLTLLSFFHCCHEGLLESAEIRNWLGWRRVEVEGDFHLHALITFIQTVVSFSLDCISVLLHARRELSHFVASLSLQLNPLFSIVLFFALHLVPLGSEDFIGDDTVSERLPRAIVSNFLSLFHLELLLLGSSELIFVERERLL